MTAKIIDLFPDKPKRPRDPIRSRSKKQRRQSVHALLMRMAKIHSECEAAVIVYLKSDGTYDVDFTPMMNKDLIWMLSRGTWIAEEMYKDDEG